MTISKRRILVSASSVLLVSALLAGVTMAWFTDTDSNQVEYTSGTLSVKFAQGDGIDLSNMKPGNTDFKDFTVVNNGSLRANVRISLVDSYDTCTVGEHSKFELNNGTWTEVTQPCANRLESALNIQTNLGTQDNVALPYEFTLDAGKTVDMKVLIDFLETAGNEYQGKHYHSKILVESAQVAKDGTKVLDAMATVGTYIDFEEAVNNPAISTISLIGDIEGTEDVVINRAVNLDLNGFTIDMKTNDFSMISSAATKETIGITNGRIIANKLVIDATNAALSLEDKVKIDFTHPDSYINVATNNPL